MKIFLKTPEEIAVARECGQLLSRTLAAVAEAFDVGVTTEHLDHVAAKYIQSVGGVPSFKGYQGFPASICASVNDAVVHGCPSSYKIQEGDIVSIDCGVYYNGIHTDSAFTFTAGKKVNAQRLDLLAVTQASLQKAIEKITTQNRMGDIGAAIQSHVEAHGYTIIRDYGGHGIGKNLHESPHIPNFGRSGTGHKIKEGMMLAIEPIVTIGSDLLMEGENKWDVRTQDGKDTAHFEHTLAVVDGKAEIMTTHEYIEEIIRKKNT